VSRPWNPVETGVTRRLRIASMVLVVTAIAVLSFRAFADDAPASLTVAGFLLLCLSVALRAARLHIHRRNRRERWTQSATSRPSP
jgi:hypothetical protein